MVEAEAVKRKPRPPNKAAHERALRIERSCVNVAEDLIAGKLARGAARQQGRA